MEHIWAYQRPETVQLAVVQQLEAFGVSVPRGDPDLQPGRGELTCGFGTSLFSQPTVPYLWREHTFQLPRIFVVLVEFLEYHVCDEGLFRKAGSVSRQRSLRCLLECPTPSIPQNSNAHDVASLLKQFLRELPHPLVPAHFWCLLEACVSLVPVKDQSECLLLSCLLLPPLHLQCLCVVMGLLGRISKGAGHSLMDASNLAIVMAPNLLETSVPPFQLCDNSLPTQTKIVKMLIESVDDLGKVPQEVGVAANHLEVRSVVMEAQSLDDIHHNGTGPLPDGKGNKLKTSATSISGFLSGWGNKIRRRKGVVMASCDGHMTLPLFRKSVKRSQPDADEDRHPKRPALEGVAPCLLRRGLKRADSYKPLPSPPEADNTSTPPPAELKEIRRSCDKEVGVAMSEDSIDCPVTTTSSHAHPAPPTPLIFTHLRTVKVRYSKTQPPVTTTNTHPDATPPPKRANICSSLVDPPSTAAGKDSTFLSPPTHCRSGAGRNPTYLDHVTRSHDLEDVFRYPPVPTLTPNLMQTISSEIDFRKDQSKHMLGRSHIHRDLFGVKSGRSSTHQECKGGLVRQRDSPRPTEVAERRSGYDNCYSASLGIKLSDLPRRKLRGRDATRNPVSSQRERRAGPSSPVVLSASLGITGLGHKQEVGWASGQDVGVVTRPRRGRKRPNRQEEQSCDLTETPPPPLVKILDSNKSRRHLLPNYLASVTKCSHAPSTTVASTSGTVVTKTATDHTHSSSTSLASCTTTSSTAGQRSSHLPAPSALHTLQECALPRPSHQRFKSPWRWGSVGSRHKYTPVSDKGNISKRAQAYMVDRSQPRPPLKRFASMKENMPVFCSDMPHPSSREPMHLTPLKRSCSMIATPTREAGHTHNIDVQEWVL